MSQAQDSGSSRNRSRGQRGRAAARTRAPKKEDHLAEQLAGYAFAAGAALVASPASAEIIYSGVQNISLANNTSQAIDLNGGGTDFTLTLGRTYNSDIFRWQNKVLLNAALAGNGVVVSQTLLPVKLAADAGIGTSPAGGAWSVGNTKEFRLAQFDSVTGRAYAKVGNFLTVYDPNPGAAGYGKWTGTPGYLGVKFDDGGNTRYGWIQVQVAGLGTDRGGSNSVLITGWAYDTTGGSILAGQTVAVPEPSGLAALAAGAAGLVAWRRLKQKKSVAAEGTQEG